MGGRGSTKAGSKAGAKAVATGGAKTSSSNAAINAMKKTAFKDEGFGQWTLDTPIGGGSILSVGGFRYGMDEVYEAQPWSETYGLAEQKKVFTTLNAAKSYIKSEVEQMYRKKHSL